MASQHAGRVALITGASSGIGVAMARWLGEAGATVILAARRVDRLAYFVGEFRSFGIDAQAVAMDVTDPASIRAAFDEAEALAGPIDTLVANAGMNVEGPAVELTVEQFDAIHAVNSRGVFLTAQEAGRRLLARGEGAARGRIVLLSSMGGLNAINGLVAYCSSKASAVMLGRALAVEWSRPGICVNVLCPGYMLTDINEEWFESEPGRRMIERLPRRRLMPIEALRPMLLALTGDAAAYTTGTVIQIDDGQLI